MLTSFVPQSASIQSPPRYRPRHASVFLVVLHTPKWRQESGWHGGRIARKTMSMTLFDHGNTNKKNDSKLTRDECKVDGQWAAPLLGQRDRRI